MANETRPPQQDRLPIKLIMPKQGAERKIPPGGTPPKPFRAVDGKYRNHLSNQVSALRSAIIPQVHRTGSAPIRVKLLSKAAAKTHRPDNLFSPLSCPIIGSGRLGELFVKATPEGLQRLVEVIERNKSDQVTKELSCVETIEPITPTFRRGGLEAKEVLRRSPRGKHGFIARVRLFNFGSDADQPKLVEDFTRVCHQRNIPISQDGYSPSSFTYGIECRDVDDVEALSRVIGVRSIMHMPLIRTIRPRMFDPKPLPAMPNRTDAAGDFPVVVVVDSGVSAGIPALESWVVGRDSQVAPQYQNSDHGTFVAGLICWGAELNPTISGLESSPCGVFDLQVIPNQDPDKGDTLALLENEFLVSLEAALQEYANKYKVWNLSLGTDTVCSLDEFSTLAEELDNFQENIKFPLSSARATTTPLRFWISRVPRNSWTLAESPRRPTAFWELRWAPSRMSITRRTVRKSITRQLSRVTVPDPIT
jgi:serine protease AprX